MGSATTTKLLAFAALVAGGWLAACSSSSASRSALDGGQDAGNDCGYPGVANNEAGCPATYATGNLPQTCAPVGLNCSYPGAGDMTCQPAILFCVAGPDGGAPHWGAAQ